MSLPDEDHDRLHRPAKWATWTNDIVTVSQNAIDLVPPTYQTIPLSAGEQVPLLDLISVMLIRSGNRGRQRHLRSFSGSVEALPI